MLTFRKLSVRCQISKMLSLALSAVIQVQVSTVMLTCTTTTSTSSPPQLNCGCLAISNQRSFQSPAPFSSPQPVFRLCESFLHFGVTLCTGLLPMVIYFLLGSKHQSLFLMFIINHLNFKFSFVALISLS